MRRLLRARVLLPLAVVAACSAEYLEGTGQRCDQDSDCPRGQLCLLGTCRPATAQNLGTVDVLVSPLPDTGMKPQAFLALDAQRASSQMLIMRPTLEVTLRSCYNCVSEHPGTVQGTLTLTAPSTITGQEQVETVPVDAAGLSRAGLLDGTSYDPVLFPADTTLPILYADRVFAAAGGTLDVTLPDPSATWTVSGRVVEDATADTPVAVEGARVWLMQATRRLVREVITDSDGHFSFPVLRTTSSGLTLRVTPGAASDPFPELTVSPINLDADRDLGLVTLGLVEAPLSVAGRISGPGGNAIAGAQVRLEGPAGAGTLRFTALTDGEGRFEGRVPAGTYARAVIPPQAAGASLVQEAALVVNAATAEALDVQLPTLVDLCGTVLDAANLRVDATRLAATRVANVEGAPGPAADATWEARETSSDTGAYCLKVPPGQYLLTATPPRGTNRPARTDLVDVASQAANTHDVILPRAAFVSGVVMDTLGKPVKLARVRAFSPVLTTTRGALELGEGYTDDQGNFTLTVPDLAGTTANGASGQGP
ncbi:MAG: carboxypeptidase regulatory-like domain-containing protein [Deltaproteobacteria bacterium]|nr:carboxypeptidase regulatory-like domain-containing protein [Deltaproteobacteria bacterium]